MKNNTKNKIISYKEIITDNIDTEKNIIKRYINEMKQHIEILEDYLEKDFLYDESFIEIDIKNISNSYKIVKHLYQEQKLLNNLLKEEKEQL